VEIEFRSIATQMYRVGLDQTGHLTLPCDIYILIFDNAWSPGQGTLLECKTGMLAASCCKFNPRLSKKN